MKKSLIALAALATVATAAQAQSSVTLYGVLDVGVGTINNVNGNTAGGNKTWTGMTTGNEATSRFGLMGTEDLGGGLKANFKLESQLFPNTGEAGSTPLTTSASASQTSNTGTASGSSSVAVQTLFDRNATVGLSGSWGGFDLGRQNNVMYDKLIAFDPRSYGNFGGLGSMGVNKMSRVNNSIKYSSPTINGFSVNALYSTAGTAGDTTAGRALEGAVNYANGPLKLVAAYSEFTALCSGASAATADGAYCAYYGSATTTTAATAGDTSLKQTLFAASYQVGSVTGIAGYLGKKNDIAKNDTNATAHGRDTTKLYWAGLKYQVNPANVVTVAYYRVNDPAVDQTTYPVQHPNMLTLDYQYSLSKRTSLYAIGSYVHNDRGTKVTLADNGKVSVGNVNNGALPTTGTNQTGYTVGIKHTF